LSDTVVVAGSYEVTPPWRTEGGVDRSIRGQHRSVRQPDTGSDPTQISYDSIIPLYSLKGKGWLTPPQWRSRRQVELA